MKERFYLYLEAIGIVAILNVLNIVQYFQFLFGGGQ